MASFVSAGVLDVSVEGLRCLPKSFLSISWVDSSLTWKSHGVCQASYPVLRCFLPMAGEDIGAVTCRLRFDEGFGMSYRSTEALWELRRFRVAGSELAGTLAIGRGVLREKRGGHRTIQMQYRYIPISTVEYSKMRYKYLMDCKR